MADYVKLLATANRLVSKNGREIVLYRSNRLSADSAKPWRGPPPVDVNEPTTADFTLTLRGVFVPPNTVREFGITSLGEGSLMEDMIKVSQQIVIVAGKEVDFREFDKLTDRGETWGIQAMQVLRPGDVTLLAFMGVRR